MAKEKPPNTFMRIEYFLFPGQFNAKDMKHNRARCVCVCVEKGKGRRRELKPKHCEKGVCP